LISATQSRFADGDGMASAFGKYFCPSSPLPKSDTTENPLALMKGPALSPGMPNTNALSEVIEHDPAAACCIGCDRAQGGIDAGLRHVHGHAFPDEQRALGGVVAGTYLAVNRRNSKVEAYIA
jgi:hypothetical protein